MTVQHVHQLAVSGTCGGADWQVPGDVHVNKVTLYYGTMTLCHVQCHDCKLTMSCTMTIMSWHCSGGDGTMSGMYNCSLSTMCSFVMWVM